MNLKKEKRPTTWHTRNWYKAEFGVDPLSLNLPFKEVPNPHYRRAPAMKLWDEQAVLPFKNERGIEKHHARSKAGQKAANTRKKNLVDLFSFFKNNDPRVQEILQRLWGIHCEIDRLHELKADHRGKEDSYDKQSYFDLGMQHCKLCEAWSVAQDRLRDERASLFETLQEICGMEKQAIQLARRYLREDGASMGKELMSLEDKRSYEQSM